MCVEIYLQSFRAINQMQSPEKGIFCIKYFRDTDT